MRDESPAIQALGRAGRRVAFHLIQAAIEGLKAIEAVIEELGTIGDKNDGQSETTKRTRIEIE